MMEQFRDYLITDRSLTDIARAEYLKGLWDPVRKKWTGTVAELEEWEAGLKGTYNAKDLNRVSLAASYLLTRLAESGYSIPEDAYPAYLVSVNVEPPGSGTAQGAFFYKGDSVTVHARPIGASLFQNWTKDGGIVSTSPDYTFTADKNTTLTANFEAEWAMETSIVGAGRIGRAILGRGL